MPPRPADAPAEPDYSRPGVLEDLTTRAGLTPETAFDVAWAFDYDEDSLRRALVAVAGIALIVGPKREHEVREAIAEGLAPYRTSDGHYRLNNEYHYLIARV